MPRIIKIGFLGLGVVGGRLLELLRENRQKLLEEYDLEIVAVKALVRDTHKSRTIDTIGLRLTTDEKELLEDEGISILVECMGGAGSERTKDILLQAIERKKHIIMSSKKCLASYCKVLLEAAERNHCQIRYDATVGGGIPICSSLRTMARGEEIIGIYGILNSTSNYILTSVNEGVTYEKALADAKQKGYTENDPTEDVDGWDAAYKLVILMNLGMKRYCDMESIEPEPMDSTLLRKESENKDSTMVMKQVACARRNADESISYFVGPCLVEKSKLVAGVKGNNNMIFVESEESGIRAFYGEGSGARPTASIMFDDLMDILSNPREETRSLPCKNVSKTYRMVQYLV